MGAPRTDLVSTLPTESLKTALNFVKGQLVSHRDMAIAAENIFSYAADQFLPDEEMPSFAGTRGSMHAPAPAVPQADIEASFARVMAPPKTASALKTTRAPKATDAAQEAGEAQEAAAQPRATPQTQAAAQATRLDWRNILQALLPFLLGLI